MVINMEDKKIQRFARTWISKVKNIDGKPENLNNLHKALQRLDIVPDVIAFEIMRHGDYSLLESTYDGTRILSYLKAFLNEYYDLSADFKFQDDIDITNLVYKFLDRAFEVSCAHDELKNNDVSSCLMTFEYPIVTDDITIMWHSEKLRISENGGVTYQSIYRKEFGKPEKITRRRHLSQEDLKTLLAKICASFADVQRLPLYMMNGDWRVSFRDKNQRRVASFHGSPGIILSHEGKELSEIIRQMLKIDDMVLFESEHQKEKLLEAIVDLRFADDGLFFRKHDFLRIDRGENYLEYKILHDDGTEIVHRIDSFSINHFLDNLTPFALKVEPKPLKDYQNPDAGYYHLYLFFAQKGEVLAEGPYDRAGIGDSWGDFIAEIYHYITVYLEGEIFNPNNFVRKKVKNEKIICTVLIDGAPSYYLCDDKNVAINSLAVIDDSESGERMYGRVVDIDYLPADSRALELLPKIDHLAEDDEFDDEEDNHYLH